jgi:hypothetical protein
MGFGFFLAILKCSSFEHIPKYALKLEIPNDSKNIHKTEKGKGKGKGGERGRREKMWE